MPEDSIAGEINQTQECKTIIYGLYVPGLRRLAIEIKKQKSYYIIGISVRILYREGNIEAV